MSARRPHLGVYRKELAAMEAGAARRSNACAYRATFDTIPGTAEREQAVVRAEAAARRRNALRCARLALTDLVVAARRVADVPIPLAADREALRAVLRAVGARVAAPRRRKP